MRNLDGNVIRTTGSASANAPVIGRPASFSLTPPQAEFAGSLEIYPAIVAGFGSGKTEALVARGTALTLQNPGRFIGVYARTYGDIAIILIPRFEMTLARLGLKYTTNKSEKTISVHGYGTLLFRSMDNPSSIVGFETVHALIDELDTLPKEQAQHAWRMIAGRNRAKTRNGARNSIAVATTPEGYRFVYENWGDNPKPGYHLIRASSYSNEANLEVGYIDGLRKLYPPALFEAYILGQFKNLESGSVYPDFCRIENNTNETIRSGESLQIGMDFNINQMAATVIVKREGRPYALEEFSKVRDTPAMCQAIRKRFGHRHPITVYPDPAGRANSSKDASLSDFSILQKAGFNIKAHTAHPLVRDRVLSVNSLILNSHGERSLLVNVKACPAVTACLEQQVYDKTGAPDKKSGVDHAGDSIGYPLQFMYPIVGRGRQLMKTEGN